MANHYKTITNVPGWLSDYTDSGLPSGTKALYTTAPLLYRAIRLRADALSAVPVKIMKGETEVDWPFPEKLEQLIWRAEVSLMLKGGGYWEKVSNKGRVVKDVQYRNPFDMTVEYKNGTLTFKQGSTGAVWVNDLRKGVYQMVYFADFDPAQDLLPGVGEAEVAQTDARLLAALSKFPEAYFEGGAMPVTLLGIDTTDTGEIERVTNWFKRSATMVKNAFRVLGMRANAFTTTTLTPELDKLAMPELYATAKHNISVAFGIPESMLDTTAANYATAQEARLGYYEDVIKPRARMFENVINTQLLAPDMEIKFAFEEMQLFQEDESKRADVLAKLKNAGLPLPVAMEIAGYSEEQIEKVAQEKEANPPPPQLQQPPQQQAQPEQQTPTAQDELRRYQRMVEKRVRAGKPPRDFESDVLSQAMLGAIAGQLEGVKDIEDVRAVFKSVLWGVYP